MATDSAPSGQQGDTSERDETPADPAAQAQPGSNGTEASLEPSSFAADGESEPSQDLGAQPSLDGTTSFIRWDEFAAASGADSTLASSLDLRSVAYHVGYHGEDLILSVASEGANNSVIVVDLDDRSYRTLPVHFDCGDCVVGSSLRGELVATATELWESLDGGYRFALLAQWDLGDGHVQRIVSHAGQHFVFGDWGWLTPAEAGNYELLDWSAVAVSVDRGGALEVNARYATLYSEQQELINANVCVTNDYGTYGSAWHSGRAVVLLCSQMVSFNPDIESMQWVDFPIDSMPVWVGSRFDVTEQLRRIFTTEDQRLVEAVERTPVIATETAWLQIDTTTSELQMLAPQATAPAGEQIFAYVVDQMGRGLRVSDVGVAISDFETFATR